MFQCQIGTGKVKQKIKEEYEKLMFQCQIGTGKVNVRIWMVGFWILVSMPNWYG